MQERQNHRLIGAPQGGKWCVYCHKFNANTSEYCRTVTKKCGTCSGSGQATVTTTVPIYGDCTGCGGSGRITKTGTRTCSICNGSGMLYRDYSYTYYYAYYRYISGLSASFANTGGCTVYATWSYGWNAGHSGSCTKSIFSNNGSSRDINQLISGIALAGANYATFNVTITCKVYFESVFARPSHTPASISPNVSNDHYEAYSGSRSYGSWYPASS